MSEIKYYFVLASENFLLEEEPLEEMLRERVQSYNKQNKLSNFWILPNPEFLNLKEFKEIKKKIKTTPIAIISTNKTFITWLKLRLNNVFTGNLVVSKESKISPLKY
jgi:hypothetical protein